MRIPVRIFERLRDEHDFERGITIVKDYIFAAKQRQREKSRCHQSVVEALAGALHQNRHRPTMHSGANASIHKKRKPD